jgi:high-affinity Fe2+/Pb2+ permease
MSDPNDPVQRRTALLPVFLTLLVGGFFCTALIVVTGGAFFYVVGVVVLFVLLGFVHYALWGAAMSEQTAGEREEMELLEKAKEPPKAPNWTYRR